MTSSRRLFVTQSLAGVGTIAVLAFSNAAQAQATVPDTDPQAMALGYKSDGTQTDRQKYTKYAAGQSCSGCALFQGKAADATGSCPVFGNKLVNAKGWCSAWAKKA
jgi:High potential iron-sulfur protein